MWWQNFKFVNMILGAVETKRICNVFRDFGKEALELKC